MMEAELETQLDVLAGLVAVLDNGGVHVLEVVGDIFGKITAIPTLTAELLQTASEAAGFFR